MTELVPQDHFDVLRLAGTLDEKRRHIILRVLAETADLQLACEAAGYKNTAPVNRLRRTDPIFEEAFKEALEAAGDLLEATAVQRATRGVREGVWYKGELVGHEVKYSDSLLATLLKAAKPDKYAERSKSESTTNIRVGIAVIPMTARKVSDWEAHSIEVHEAQKALDAPKGAAIEGQFTEVTETETSISRG